MLWAVLRPNWDPRYRDRVCHAVTLNATKMAASGGGAEAAAAGLFSHEFRCPADAVEGEPGAVGFLTFVR